MTARHFIARLNATLDGQIHLDSFQHTGSEIIATLQLALFILITFIKYFAAFGQQFLCPGNLFVQSVFVHPQLEPFFTGIGSDDFFRQLVAFFETGSLNHRLPYQCGTQPFKSGIFHNAVFIIQVLTELIQRSLLDLQGALILFQPVTGEHLHINHRTLGT